MDYRKFYQKKLNVKINNDFEIHHIDFNRENNDIINLVAIPKHLHNDYHELYKQINFEGLNLNLSPINFPYNGVGYNKFVVSYFIKFTEILEEIQEWIYYRDSILYNMPYLSNKTY